MFWLIQHQVRSEARKVHDLFFDILKIAFPDTDFSEARSGLSFSISGSGAAALSSPRQAPGQSRRNRLINEVELDPSTPQRLQQQTIVSSEEGRVRVRLPNKESRFGSGGSSSREQYVQDDSPALTHPGELVVCKKKRKDREKTVVKPRTGSTGPLSPSTMGRGIQSPGTTSASKDTRNMQQGWANQSGHDSGASVGWANPVKRLRTDSGKRRPSHL